MTLLPGCLVEPAGAFILSGCACCFAAFACVTYVKCPRNSAKIASNLAQFSFSLAFIFPTLVCLDVHSVNCQFEEHAEHLHLILILYYVAFALVLLLVFVLLPLCYFFFVGKVHSWYAEQNLPVVTNR